MSVRVAVRARPFSEVEKKAGSKPTIAMDGNSVKVLASPQGPPHLFTMDFAYWSVDDNEKGSQASVFEDLGQGVLDHTFTGYNSCVFAYGQTGSGKTYSMMGEGWDQSTVAPSVGLIPRIAHALFDFVDASKKKGHAVGVRISFLEIYCEKVRCLLDPAPEGFEGHYSGLKVREHPVTGPYVDGLAQIVVNTKEEFLRLMRDGNSIRTTASTAMNQHSSRSHAVFTVLVTQKKKDGEVNKTTTSRMNLVDLAGSERQSKTGAHGSRLIEGSNINKSLSTLGLVISNLADSVAGRVKHIPYRDSVLTWILKDNLGGNSKTVMLAAISPSSEQYEETLSTLRYAESAKKIVNKAVINESNDKVVIGKLQDEIRILKEQLEKSGGVKETASLQEKLDLSEDILKEMNMTWEERLKETENIMREREVHMNQMKMVLVEKEKKIEHLSSELDETKSSLEQQLSETQRLKEKIRAMGGSPSQQPQDMKPKPLEGRERSMSRVKQLAMAFETSKHQDPNAPLAKPKPEAAAAPTASKVKDLAKAFDTMASKPSLVVSEHKEVGKLPPGFTVVDATAVPLEPTLGEDEPEDLELDLEEEADEIVLEDEEGIPVDADEPTEGVLGEEEEGIELGEEDEEEGILLDAEEEDEEIELADVTDKSRTPVATPPPVAAEEEAASEPDSLQLEDEPEEVAKAESDDFEIELELDIVADDPVPAPGDGAAAAATAPAARRLSIQDMGDEEPTKPRIRGRGMTTSQKPEDQPHAWTCEACTFLNLAQQDVCEMCEGKREKAEVAAEPTAQPKSKESIPQLSVPSHALHNNRYLREAFRVVKLDEGALIGAKKDRIWEIDFFQKRFGNLDMTGYLTFSLPSAHLFRVEKDHTDCRRLTLYFFDTPHPYLLAFSSAERRQRFFEIAMIQKRNSVLWCPYFCPAGEDDAIVTVTGTNIQRSNGRSYKVKGEGNIHVGSLAYEVLDVWFGIISLQNRGLPKASSVFNELVPRNLEVYVFGLIDVPHAMLGGNGIGDYFSRLLGPSYYILINTAADSSLSKSVSSVIVVLIRRAYIIRVANIETIEVGDIVPKDKRQPSMKPDYTGVAASFRVNESTMAFFVVNVNPHVDDIKKRCTGMRALLHAFRIGNMSLDVTSRFDYSFVGGSMNCSSPFSPKHGVKDELTYELQVGNFLSGFKEGTPDATLQNTVNPPRIFAMHRPKTCRTDIKKYYMTPGLNMAHSAVNLDIFTQRHYLSAFNPPSPRTQLLMQKITLQGARLPDLKGAELQLSGEWIENSPLIIPLEKCPAPSPGVTCYAANNDGVPPLRPVTNSFEFLRLQSVSVALFGILDAAKSKKKKDMIASGCVPLKIGFALGDSVPFDVPLLFRSSHVGSCTGAVLQLPFDEGVGSEISGVQVKEKNSIAVCCYENEQLVGNTWVPSQHPMGPHHFSDVQDPEIAAERDSFELPQGGTGWTWLGDWRHEARGSDPEGWNYADTFVAPFGRARTKSSTSRRRRWNRLMQASSTKIFDSFCNQQVEFSP